MVRGEEGFRGVGIVFSGFFCGGFCRSFNLIYF